MKTADCRTRIFFQSCIGRNVFIRYIVFVIFFAFYGCVQVVSAEDIMPPPVEVQLDIQNTPIVGETINLKLTVKAIDDLDVDISCLLPMGVEPVLGEDIVIRPYQDLLGMHPDREGSYSEEIMLWVGSLKAGEIKESQFSLAIKTRGRYEIIARIQALAQWGEKEEVLLINY